MKHRTKDSNVISIFEQNLKPTRYKLYLQFATLSNIQSYKLILSRVTSTAIDSAIFDLAYPHG